MNVAPSAKDISAKVQLHVHLDGALRLETAWELLRQKNCIPDGISTLEELKSIVLMKNPETLTSFLDRFMYFAPSYIGDLDAIRRIALEFAEDCKKDNVIYCEARYSPHLMAGQKTSVNADNVVDTVTRAFWEAEKIHGIKLRSILCCMREMPDISGEVLDLCRKYKDHGVVGIDIAGEENALETGTPTQAEHFKAYEAAEQHGIHRTAHAGANGSCLVVKEAVEAFKAERIGHGYHSLDDEEVYQMLLLRGIHIEVCPWSSVLSGATSGLENHPAKRFAADRANFSISTDDPTITGTTLSDEFGLLVDAGMSALDLIQTNFNAARSSFLPDDEKEELLNKLRCAYAHVPEAASF